MRSQVSLSLLATLLVLVCFKVPMESSRKAYAYPPAVGILGTAKNCLACHVDNGPWKDDARTIVDILEQESKHSLRQPDGNFLIEAKRGQARTVLTVIGRTSGDELAPHRNAWLYVDPKTIGTKTLSKFAPGWDVNLPMSCRIAGDALPGREGAKLTVLPMTIRPTDAAQDAKVVLQVMLTEGESIKGNPREGMIGNYFERQVLLRVVE